ncbi:MAG: hypothetical protein QM496_18020 [Verrucomicrobiota bacterium]
MINTKNKITRKGRTAVNLAVVVLGGLAIGVSSCKKAEEATGGTMEELGKKMDEKIEQVSKKVDEQAGKVEKEIEKIGKEIEKTAEKAKEKVADGADKVSEKLRDEPKDK